MKHIFLCFLCSLLLLACSDKPVFVSIPLSAFEIRNDLLPDKQVVKVLSFSGMPDRNEKLDYYAHLLVVSAESKDTFNLLCVKPSEILKDADKEMHFLNQNSDFYQSILSGLRSEYKLSATDSISQVMVEEQFVANTKNQYPTVIGMLGTVTEGN